MAHATQGRLDDLGAPLFATTFVVVDLETTGLSPTTDRITEVGAVKVRGGDVLGEFHALVHPGLAIPVAVTTLTGITDASVQGCPPVEAVLPTFLEFARDAVLVGHNVAFDLGFLRAELARHGYPTLDPVVVDTRRLARRLLRGEVRDLRLSTLAAHLRSRWRPEHRALADARATVDVLHGLLERAGSLGVVTLEDLRDYQRTRSDPLFRKVSLVRDAPREPGVYRFLDDRGEVLYVGKSADLRARLRSYFGADPRRSTADLVRLTHEVRWQVTPTELEAAVREVRAIHAHRPRFNRRSRHPERAVYVKLTTERFPRLSIVTTVRDDGATYVGPIASRRTAQVLVDAVHDALPVRRCTGRLRIAQDHPPCVLKDLGRCGAPCDGTQSVDDYAQVVTNARVALTGDADALLHPLRRAMRRAADRGRFERATTLRARLHTTARLLTAARDLRALVAVEELCATRPAAGGDLEAVLVRHGRLIASARLDRTVTDGTLALQLGASDSAPSVGPGLPGRGDAEEVGLVAAWLAEPGVRVRWCRGTYAVPTSGGAGLATTVAESRRVAREVRHDRRRLRGEKTARRSA